MQLAVVATGITAIAIAVAFASSHIARRTRARHVEPRDETAFLRPSSVRVLRTDVDVEAALERAATSERQLMDRASQRYAHYQHFDHPTTPQRVLRSVGPDIELGRPPGGSSPSDGIQLTDTQPLDGRA